LDKMALAALEASLWFFFVDGTATTEIYTERYTRALHDALPTWVAELAGLGRSRGVPVFDDVGSGALVDYARFGFTGEPLARRSLEAGADLVLFSGDKLLGGPQAGIIAGRKEFIQKIEKDPLMRAFRLDKMTLAALEASLRLYLEEGQALREVPVLRMLGAAEEELKARAEGLAGKLSGVRGVEEARVARDEAFVGGGSLPDQAIPSWVVEVKAGGMSDEELGRRLRTGTPAVLGRLRDGRVVLDVRTVFAEQEGALVEAVRQAVAGTSGGHGSESP
jgi:L-seryl-tRNA(Ser) seleniumtransferase